MYTTIRIRQFIDVGATRATVSVLDRVARIVITRVEYTDIFMCTTMSTLHLTKGSTGRVVCTKVNTSYLVLTILLF